MICKSLNDIPAGYLPNPLESSSNYIITEKTSPNLNNGLGKLLKAGNHGDTI
jgi:hypothetical protein